MPRDALALDRLKDIISEKRMSQGDLAYRSELPQSTISRIIKGGRTRPPTVYAIAQALGVEPRELTTDEAADRVLMRTSRRGAPVPLSLVAGQRGTVDYPEVELTPEAELVRARINHMEKQMAELASKVDRLSEGVEEMLTRPSSVPAEAWVYIRQAAE